MLKYFVEFLGTFLFLSVVIATNSPLLISLALLAVVLLGQSISGGHFNPAISIMMWLNGAISLNDMAMYCGAQIVGGVVAFGVFRSFLAPLSNGTW